MWFGVFPRVAPVVTAATTSASTRRSTYSPATLGGSFGLGLVMNRNIGRGSDTQVERAGSTARDLAYVVGVRA